jgi:hypothetical protein
MLMNKLRIQRSVIAITLPLILMSFVVFLSSTKFFTAHDYELSIGITVDLLFSIPLCHFLLFKSQNHVKYSTALFFTAGIIVASLIVPKSDQYFLRQVRLWIVPVIELCSIAFLVLKARKEVRRYNQVQKLKRDFYTVFKGVTTEILPRRLALIVSAEISAFYYVFFSWRKPTSDSKVFTYYKEGGIIALMGIFIFMILIEASVFHLLLAKWNETTAWAFSGVSLYAGIQAFGIARSIIKRPIQITEDQVFIPYGILSETTFDLKDILSIKTYDKQLATAQNSTCLSPFAKIDEPDVIIELGRPYHIEQIYGGRKKFDLLLINVDNKVLFIERIQKLLDSSYDAINKPAES